jgi:hypothetical protein
MWTALIYMLSSGIELDEIFWRVDRNNEINSIAIASCESELDSISADMCHEVDSVSFLNSSETPPSRRVADPSG